MVFPHSRVVMTVLTAGASGSAPRGLPLLLCGLGAQALLLLPQLGCKAVAEVLGLEHLADLDLGLAGHGIGATLRPCDRLVQGTRLDEPEAGDQLVCGEGPVDHG